MLNLAFGRGGHIVTFAAIERHIIAFFKKRERMALAKRYPRLAIVAMYIGVTDITVAIMQAAANSDDDAIR